MPSTTTSRPYLLVNMSSGDDRDTDDLLAAARELGVTVIEIEPPAPDARDDEDDVDDFGPGVANRADAEPPDDENPLEAAIRQAIEAGADVIGMAGGDGSLGLVAQAAMEADIPFVCIPFGTRNHFARDVGLDRKDPVGALAAFHGLERRVDVGRVNGRVFLNNVTCGVYAEAVHEDAYRERKIRTVARVGTELLKGEREGDPIIIDGPEGAVFESPFALLISNNCYELDSMGLPGTRERLDRGELQVCVVDVERGAELLGVAATATGRNLEEHPAFHQWLTSQQVIRSDEPLVKAGVDGEATELCAPVCVEVDPRALRILLPTEVAVEIDLDPA